ncbi:hypothetical protein DEU38_10226 [Rhodococcus sp. AG1013]|uniref:hypothetical protein n=1 Tax=Rhodococcus sp. AG1013 TaxID=2183996 RepID=UPI000E0C88D1|nr:hypothetical protein [Rhodococcus sp. AG1013]RDI33671.1 hypothetical protein DEU38_10226 [Rhodococcus sp. AG1013]
MAPTVRVWVPAVAAWFAGTLATFVLANPPEWRGTINVTGRQLEWWLDALPTGSVIGAALAVPAYVALRRAHSLRPAWAAAVVAASMLIAARIAVPGVRGLVEVTTLHYAKCVAAGLLLGAAVAAVWMRPFARFVLATAVASTLVVAHTAHATNEPSVSTLGPPFWWLLIPALVLAAVCVVIDTAHITTAGTDRIMIQAIAAATTLAFAHRTLGAWIDGQTTNSELLVWVFIGVCLVLVTALTEFWARRVDSPFLLAATAVAAAAALVTPQIARQFTLEPWLMVSVGVAAVAGGLAVAVRRSSPPLGFALLALIPLSTAIDPDVGDGRAWLLARLAVLGLGIGLALGSTLPDDGALASLGLAVPLLSLVFTYVAQSDGAIAIYSGTHERPPHTEGGLFGAVEPYAPVSHLAGVALLIVVLYCAVAIRRLRTRPASRAE